MRAAVVAALLLLHPLLTPLLALHTPRSPADRFAKLGVFPMEALLRELVSQSLTEPSASPGLSRLGLSSSLARMGKRADEPAGAFRSFIFKGRPFLFI